MNKFFALTARTKPEFFYPILSTLLTILIVLLTYLVAFTHLPEKLPLFYSRPWGESQLAFKSQYFILPVVTLLITLVNTFIAGHLHPSQKVLKNVLLGSIILVNLIIITAAVRMVLIFV